MKLNTLLREVAKVTSTPDPVEGSERLGRAVGQAMADVEEKYNSLNVLYVDPAEHELGLNFMMYAGSPVSIASMLRRRFKENGLAPDWKTYKIGGSVDHEYHFDLPPAPGLDRAAFMRGVKAGGGEADRVEFIR